MGDAKRRKLAGTYPNPDAPPAVTSWDAGPTQLHLIELMLDDPRLMRRMPLWQRVIGVAVGTGQLFVPADTVISVVGDIRAPDAVDSLSEALVMQAALDDGVVETAVFEGHPLVPADWMERRYPWTAEHITRVAAICRQRGVQISG